MSWRVLYVEESDGLSLYLDNIKIKRAANELTFPLSDISLVLIDNFKLTITANLINGCVKRNIPIIICGDNHHPAALILPVHGHFECTKILFNQLSWSEELKGVLWQLLVKQKIKNQLCVLKKRNPTCESISIIEKYIDEVRVYDETNREGLAAKLYFRGLFGVKFSRHDTDVVNACLDYGYSVLRAIISKTLVAKGLNTQLGIFHKGPQNAFNLSDDVIEIFRPIIDSFVYDNFLNEKIFVREHRVRILEILNMKLNINGQRHTIYHVVEKVIDEIIRFFKDGKVDNLISFDPELYDL